MLNVLEWNKPLVINGVAYENSQAAYAALKDFDGEIKINLNPREMPKPQTQSHAQNSQPVAHESPADEYQIEVRAYMTKEFGFHDSWNKGIPMPMRTMAGEVLKETQGMYKMRLYAKPMPSSTCMKCGRTLTHPVSLLYGIGPECGQHFHINPFSTEEELRANYEALRQKMADIKWEGWIPKKAILVMEKIEKIGKAV